MMDALVGRLAQAQLELEAAGDPLECDIVVSDGDWGGSNVLIKVSPWSALQIARQLIQLVERDFSGAHFDVDKASIAVETAHQLCFSLVKHQ